VNNVGFPMTEFVFETVLRDGLGELVNNLSRVDDLFARFNEAHMINQFGQSAIDKVKEYLTNNQIKITHAFAVQPSQMPCFSIQIIASVEEPGDQHLGNTNDTVYRDKDPTIFNTSITPLSFDSNTGKVVVDNSVDLSTLCVRNVFVDASGNKYSIKAPLSNLSGNKYFTIEPTSTVTLNQAGRIESSIDFEGSERKLIRLREAIRIGVHVANDIHLTKYLYYVLFYILKSRNDALINRGVELAAGTASIFDKVDEYQGHHIYQRFIDVECLTEFNWDQAVIQAADCFELTMKVPAPKSNSEEEVVYGQ